MNRYTKICLIILSALCLTVIDGKTASFSTIEGATGSRYVTYDGAKRSRFCRFKQASRCASLGGFMSYLNAGCVNDTDRESKCLRTFCGRNCAGDICPDSNTDIGQACQRHCQFVNLGNAAAQARLQACVRGAYSSSQAALKEAGRTLDRAQLRAVRGQQRGADQEARRKLSELKKYVRGRDSLFISMRRSASRTLKNWILATDKAKRYTSYINQVNGLLQRGAYPQDRQTQAKEMVDRSNMLALDFVKMVGTLSNHAEALGRDIRSGTVAASTPLSQAQIEKEKEALIEPSAPSATSFDDLPPPPREWTDPPPASAR